MSHLIAPSFLSADFGKVREEVEMINNSDADWLHIDIMDGVFVPNISFGFPVLEAINKVSKKPLDVHLMIEQPERYIDTFVDHGAEVLTLHYEACVHLHRALDYIRKKGIKSGVALNPSTPVHVLEDFLDMIDLVCLMSVNPGFGGQSFIQGTLHKTAKLNRIISRAETETLIEIDGGVTLDNASDLLVSGADVLVAGSTVFKSPDPQNTIKELKSVSTSRFA